MELIKLKNFLFYLLLIFNFFNNVECIFNDDFTFTFVTIKKLNTETNYQKLEIEAIFNFEKQKKANNLFLTALIPARNLHILQFIKEQNEEENVSILDDIQKEKPKDNCDYVKEVKNYYNKLSENDKKKFRIYTDSTKESSNTVPDGYNFFKLSLKTFFNKEQIINTGKYIVILIVEIKNNSLNLDEFWIFSISQNEPTKNQNECTIFSENIAKDFFKLLNYHKMYLLYCNSVNNSEILNILKDVRKNINLEIQSTKLIYGSTDVEYSGKMNLKDIKENIMISIQLPINLCFSSSCFNKNIEDPCKNLIQNKFKNCEYVTRTYEFILIDKKENINEFEFKIQNINNPLLDLESDNNWIVNISTLNKSKIILNEENLKLLEKKSTDVCSKNFIKKLKEKHFTYPWVYSHIGIKQSPKLTYMEVKPIEVTNLLENPLNLKLKLNFTENKIFENCFIILKSIHNFISINTKTEDRINIYNYKLIFPSLIYTEDLEKNVIKIKTNGIKNNDEINALFNVKKYNDEEYWFFKLECLNNNNYSLEAQTKFIFPIIYQNIHINDIFIKEYKNNIITFYVNILLIKIKEVKITVVIPNEEKNIKIPDTCVPEILSSCYNLINYNCIKEKKMIKYQIKSYKNTDKYLTIYFPIEIVNKTKESKLKIEVETIFPNVIKVNKEVKIDEYNKLINNIKTPCANDIVTKLKKYKKYSSHLFILFKVVNCNKIYEPFLINANNNEHFYVKTNNLDNSEQFNFQKAYLQKYPIINNSISQKIFNGNIVAIQTVIFVDNLLLNKLDSNETKFLTFLKNKVFFQYNKYYIVINKNKNTEISLCSYISSGNTKCNILETFQREETLYEAFQYVYSFILKEKERIDKTYMNTELTFLLLLNKENVFNKDMISYNKKTTDINKKIIHIYIVYLELVKTLNVDNEFNLSLQDKHDIKLYTFKNKINQIVFISNYNYKVYEKMLYTFIQAIVNDYITLHTKLYKTSWVLIGICRNNLNKGNNTNKSLKLYYANKYIKSISYSIPKDEIQKKYQYYTDINDQSSNLYELCNIFTQLQLIGLK